jgi:cell division protein FtsB
MRRARVALLAAVAASFLALVAWLPVSLLLSQHAELASLSTSLSSLESRNAAMRAEDHALSSNAAVATIAHEQYGLVKPGQQAYVILPKAGSADGSGLNSTAIPLSDLVPTAQENYPSPATGAPEPGFWSRFVGRLEFWRGAAQ